MQLDDAYAVTKQLQHTVDLTVCNNHHTTMQPLNQAAINGHGRIHQLLSTIPLGVTIILFVNILMFCLQTLLDWDIGAFSICAIAIESPYWQVYRIVSSAFIHGGILHIAMNMFAAYSMCGHVEKQMGTLALLGQNMLFAPVTGIVYLLIQHTCAVFTQNDNYLAQCSVGYSGILFAYVTIGVALEPDGQRSIFGFFAVPAYLYPLTLLAVISFLMPNISWMGHLSGVIVGWLYCKGLLRMFTLPRHTVKWIDDTIVPSFISSMPNYTAYPGQHDYLEPAYINVNWHFREVCGSFEERYNAWRERRHMAAIAAGSYAPLDQSSDVEAQRNGAEHPSSLVSPASGTSRFTGPTSFAVGGSIRGAPPRSASNVKPDQIQTATLVAPIDHQASAPSYQMSLSHPAADAIDDEETQIRLAIEKSLNDT